MKENVWEALVYTILRQTLYITSCNFAKLQDLDSS